MYIHIYTYTEYLYMLIYLCIRDTMLLLIGERNLKKFNVTHNMSTDVGNFIYIL